MGARPPSASARTSVGARGALPRAPRRRARRCRDGASTCWRGPPTGTRSSSDPFNRARALLALGGVRLRARQKRTGSDALEEALAGFEALGAIGWAANARGELARVGGRERIEGLSPSELRVAELVAEGRTNREIAAALFLGERTVASHLTHIYAKLGIRSRTELARQMAATHCRDRRPGEQSSDILTFRRRPSRA